MSDLKLTASVAQTGTNAWRITTATPYGNGWGVGADFPDEETAKAVAEVIVTGANGDLASLITEIRDALEGDSNDAEHNALVLVADLFGIEYTPSDD